MEILNNIMPHDTEEDSRAWGEQILSLSKNIMQSGKPLLWTIAGALDYFENAYNRRYFTEIYFLALLCISNDLEKRMREGRHIADSYWINSSVDHNGWFIEKGIVSGKRIDTYDITGKSISDVADYVIQWVDERL